jgi:hypothetical protein
MIRKILPFVVILCFSFSNFSFSQSSIKKEPLKHVNYNINVDLPLNKKELLQIKEVYGDKAENDILSKPQRLKDIKNILRNRVEIIQYQNKSLSGFKLLSEVSLFNDYNNNLKRDLIFDKTNFNPLKYQFDFYSRNSSTYRVDNTQYLIVIKSQHQ